MELKISDIPPTICLNMIVKNESHIIKETLEMLCNKITFSYWVICDTGSTDNTQTIITDFFKSKDIPGELYNNEWKNFAYNRTLALDAAFNKTDLLFVFDADDEIHGNIKIPTNVDSDGYLLNFGTSSGTSYQRVLLVNNRIKWNYKSVIHEYINCLKPNAKITSIDGDYYIVSGRRGSRNNDPEKYLKDAKILEEAYHEAHKINDTLYLRYGFYCANSYKDAGKPQEAIKWYKVTLNNENWSQEKYMCCLNLYQEYNKIGEKEKAFYYLIESFKYDTERMECIYHLVYHYSLSGSEKVAYAYYSVFRDFYENKYIQSSNDGKLFVENDKANFYFPYYMILVADKVKDFFPEAKNSITNMFKIAFTKKHPTNEDFYIGNLLYNLQFFIESCIVSSNGFIELFQNYVNFLEQDMKLDLSKHQFLKNFEKYGIKFQCFKAIKTNFSIEECKQSKNILFYAGFANMPWNYTYSINNALGGSETAVANLAKSFPSDFKVYIGGFVAEETVENVTYINLDNLKNFVKTTPFHTVIVSRYIAFYEMFPETSFYQSFIWGHDVSLQHYGCNQDVNYILNKWNDKIDGCVCQTEWHKSLFAQQYPQLKDKIFTINNGILVDKFIYKSIKITNRFIYTSCSERGLERLLELWPQIIGELPDAELFIASYNKFPQNEFEKQLYNVIQKYDSIKHVGTLNREKLYELMSSAEFWLYPTNWNETSCITSMEMLMSEVICLYYPVAGLVNTLGEYGITIQRDNEINALLSLSTKQKYNIRKKGKEYALTCSWNNRTHEWINLCKLNNTKDINKKWIFYCPTYYNEKTIKQYIENLNTLFTDYKIALTCDKQYILNINPDKITFVFEIFDESIVTQLPNCSFSYLNTEPLNIPVRLQNVLDILHKYNFDYYDYSKSNIKIINDKFINTTNLVYLPYSYNKNEIDMLTNLNNNTNKIYDFGLIVGSCGDVTERRKPIVDFLIQNNFSVNIISGWDMDRDIELAKCNIILNLHGFYTIPSDIFEHIRCDRLLMSGFKILSEKSFYLDTDFKNKFPNLKIIEYNEFFNYDVISKIVATNNNNKDCDNLNTDITSELVIDKLVSNYGSAWTGHMKFAFKLVNILNPKIIVDLGVDYGHSTFSFASAKKGIIYGIDSFEGDPQAGLKNTFDIVNNLKNEFLSRKLIINNLNFIKGYFDDVFENFNETIDILHIDGLHTIEAVSNDYNKWIEKTSENAVILFHDIVSYPNSVGVVFNNITYPKFYFTHSAGLGVVCKNYRTLQIILEHELPNKDDIVLVHEPFVFPITNSIKIIDSFIFYNELELLNYRLNILNDVVDYFVLVESTHTFTGKEKPLYFKDNQERFSKFRDKIIHIIVTDFPYKNNINIDNNEQWINEKFQRNCISRGLEQINLNNNDIITICDLDEIPDSKILLKLKNSNQDIDIKIVELDFYYYNLNCKRREKWHFTKILSYNKYKQLNAKCDDIRFINAPLIKQAGWHLSYFGDTEFIKNKLINFSHQEYNNEQYTNVNKIQQNIDNCTDLFHRTGNDMDYIEIENNNYLPPMYNIYLQNFYKLNPKNFCFIHSCCLEKGKTERLDYLINTLINSNCINILSKIYIINIGQSLDDNYIQNLNINQIDKTKFEIDNYSSNTKLQEAATINKMILFSKENTNCNILYIHTKGVRYQIDDTKQLDWINMMLYFLLYKSNDCINYLNNNYLSVGCNYFPGSSECHKHYSGNFWWAKSQHLKKLAYLDENTDQRGNVEFHLFSVDHSNFAIHNSGINHYLENYPEDKYKTNNKNTEKILIKYGIINNNIDITNTVYSICRNNDLIHIPSGYYNRDYIFGDPIIGTHKFIIVQVDTKIYMFNEHQDVNINLTNLHISDQFMTHSDKKYKLSACIMLKNETENLNDWLEHYVEQGVEHFFILSNNSTDNIRECVNKSLYKDMVTLLIDNRDLNIYNNSVEHRQILCDNFYRLIKTTSEWSILVDIDEFMSGKNGYTISSFIDTIQPDIGCVYVYWNIFKPTIDIEGNIAEKFERKKSNKRINLDILKDLSYEINFASKFGKSLFRTSMLNDDIRLWIHKVPTNGTIITNYGNISDYKYDNDDNIVWSEDNYKKLDIILNHYVIRNKKDYDRKMSQLENTHRHPFVKGALDIISLDDTYFIEYQKF
jgi:beta-1,4-mannosyl-glycoprotein beta-1,4-N-acetylglucosaminyltransferase